MTNEEIAAVLRSIADSLEPGPAHGGRMSYARDWLRGLANKLLLPPPPDDARDSPIDDLWLSSRALRVLKAFDILTIRQAMEMTDEELMRLPEFGVKSLHDVRVSIKRWCDEQTRENDSAPVQEGRIEK
jgi:hypothetical protein